jgi:translation elongation factor EF-4
MAEILYNILNNKTGVTNFRQIKNHEFSIIAHIDHGKSTLADRLLESTSTVATRDMEDSFSTAGHRAREGDNHKGARGKVNYKAPDGETYQLNLIDTPATSTSTTRSQGRSTPATAPCSWSTPSGHRGQTLLTPTSRRIRG